MSISATVLLLAVLYLAVAGATRKLRTRWNLAENDQKLAQAGTLAFFGALQSFLQCALITLGGLAVFLALGWLVSPVLAGKLVEGAHSAAAFVLLVADGLKEGLILLFLWGLLLLLFWLAWQGNRRSLSDRLRSEYLRQEEELTRKQEAGELEPLPPNQEIRALFEELIKYANPATGELIVPQGMTPEAAAAVGSRLMKRLLALDIERRVDLTEVQVLPIAPDRAAGWWPRLRLALFSRGTDRTRRSLSLYSGRAATAAACLLVMGVGTPGALAGSVQPYLTHLTDLEVMQSRDAAEQSFKRMFAPPPLPSARIPPAAYQALAQHLVQSLAQAPAFHARLEAAVGGGQAAQASSRVGDYALEEAILREAAAPAPDMTPRLQLVSLDAVNVPAEVSRDYATLVQRVEGKVGGSGRLAGLLKAAAERNPRIAAAVADYWRSFGQSQRLWDIGDSAVAQLVERAAEVGLPEIRGKENPFVGKTWKSSHKGLEAAAEHFVRERVNRALVALASGSVTRADAALGEGKGDLTGFTSSEAGDVQNFLDQLAERRKALIAVLPPAPTVQHAFDDRERNLVAQVKRMTHAGDARDIVTFGGGFDDSFPGIPRGRATTPLQQAFENGGTAVRTDVAVQTARDWNRLDADSRIGGVIIGLSPSGQVVGKFTNLLSSRSGNGLDISLVDGRGNLLRLGHFTPEVVQQAIAYAADGRLTAVTITGGWGPRRIQLHPILDGTALGCDAILLDELVFAEAERDQHFVEWNARVQRQQDVYDQVAGLVRAGLENKVFPPPQAFQGWRAGDAQTSVLAHYRSSFSEGIVSAIDTCQGEAGAHDAIPFWKCVYSQDPPRDAPERQIGIRSGVREVGYDMAGYDFARPGPRAVGTWPFKFELIAAVESTMAKEEAAEPAWTFPPLGDLAQRSADASVANKAKAAAVLQHMQQFTLLQRVARLGLGGQLGAAFPKLRLLGLMREAKAAGSIPSVRTPLWGDTATGLAVPSGPRMDVSAKSSADVENLAREVATQRPEIVETLHRCADALRHPFSPLANDGGTTGACRSTLAMFGTPYERLLYTARFKETAPLVISEFRDRLRDTAACPMLASRS